MCDTANVFVQVGPGPPETGDDKAKTAPLTPITVDVTENDSQPNGLPLEVTGIASQAENGVCELVGGAFLMVRYTPFRDFNAGTDQCTYTICVEGTTVCSEGTLTVDVVPSKPVANDDKAETAPQTPVTVDVADNDSHPEDLPLEVTGIASQPENGVCKLVRGCIQYTPNKGFTGTDKCTYVICVEDTAECDAATLVVDVIVQPPVARDDKECTPLNTPVIIVSHT